MLLAFRVKNFLSFHEDTILDLRPNEKIKSQATHIICDKFEALKTIPIYGANASGKSNLLLAIYYMRELILFSIFGPPHRNVIEKIVPFGFDCNETPTEFEMLFYFEERLYLYGFSIRKGRITEEWLDVNGQTIFSRAHNSINSVNPTLSAASYNTDYLFLVALWRLLSIEDRVALIGRMELFFKTNLLCLNSHTIGAFSPTSAIYSNRLCNDQTFQENVLSFLRLADPTIDSFDFYEDTVFDESSGRSKDTLKLRFKHKFYSDHGGSLGVRPLPLSCESTGTIQLLLFIQLITDFTEKGGTLVIDELSAHLHPLLVEYILNFLQRESNTKAQLIYSTHSAEIMAEQFRDDECYLVEKDEKGRSTLYSLAAFNDIPTNRTEAYLQGRFGAVPKILPSFLSKGGVL